MIYCVADVHIANHRLLGGLHVGGLNIRACRALEVLEAAARTCERGDALAILGDMFDHHHPVPALISGAERALLRGGHPNTWILAGNHDQSSGVPGDNACAPMLGVATLVEMEWNILWDLDTAALMVPFGTPPLDKIRSALDQAAATVPAWSKAKKRLVLGHFGISQLGDAPWMRSAANSVDVEALADLCASRDVDGVAAGDWHKRRHWSYNCVDILQVGALVPTGWDNPGWTGYGTLARWDGHQWLYTELPGPRFLTHRVTENELREHPGCQPYLRLEASDSDEAEELREEMQALGAVVHVDIVDVARKERARKAAAAVRETATVRAALKAYLKQQALPDGVTAQHVLDLVEAHLPGG